MTLLITKLAESLRLRFLIVRLLKRRPLYTRTPVFYCLSEAGSIRVGTIRNEDGTPQVGTEYHLRPLFLEPLLDIRHIRAFAITNTQFRPYGLVFRPYERADHSQACRTPG